MLVLGFTYTHIARSSESTILQIRYGMEFCFVCFFSELEAHNKLLIPDTTNTLCSVKDTKVLLNKWVDLEKKMLEVFTDISMWKFITECLHYTLERLEIDLDFYCEVE